MNFEKRYKKKISSKIFTLGICKSNTFIKVHKVFFTLTTHQSVYVKKSFRVNLCYASKQKITEQ